MTYHLINPITHPTWNTDIAAFPQATIFHTSLWAKVLQEAYRYQPLYLTKLDNNEIIAVFPFFHIHSLLTGKRGVSIPFSDYCPPLIKHEIDEAEIHHEIARLGRSRNWRYYHVKAWQDVYRSQTPNSSYYLHTIDLSPPLAELKKKCRTNTRRNIKRANESGISIQKINSRQGIRIFYELHCATRRRHGLPPQPIDFFYTILNELIYPGFGAVSVAFYRDSPVAANMYFEFNRKALYKYGASDDEHLEFKPNDALMWAAIKEYQKRKFRELSLGKTEMDHDGLRHFKQGWGTEEIKVLDHKYSFKRDAFVCVSARQTTIPKTLTKLLPQRMLVLFGKLLYRHIG
ncbi:MAG: GNAT family N-acetyltransferase [Chitinivibrionales bacterium]|nr:GNAT family N-acetyltransferase [Chitinivibrionales bacterium]